MRLDADRPTAAGHGKRAVAQARQGQVAFEGLPPVADDVNGEPVYARVWAMDTDHTTNNRYQPDALKPDCSVRVS